MTRDVPPADDDRRPDSPARRIDTASNLLLGLLALQNNFIDRDALLGAFNAWVADRSRGLGRILLDRGALSPPRRQLLEALVEEHIRMHGDDPEKSLAALSSIGSVRDDLSRVADPEVQESLAHVSAARSHQDDDPYRTVAPSSVGESTSAGTRFRILRPHARGGLGEVFVALDTELNRDVALKEIQDRFADDPRYRARFEFEAEVTGGLEHPGIVPVYGLGHTADGRPFYAMRFIKGNSLKEAIQRFHRGRETAGARPGREHAGAARAAGAVHRRLRCDGVCARPAGAASRPQAGQHHAGQVRRDAGGRLGPGQGAGRTRARVYDRAAGAAVEALVRQRTGADAGGIGGGNARLHEPRAGGRPGREAGGARATSTAWARPSIMCSPGMPPARPSSEARSTGRCWRGRSVVRGRSTRGSRRPWRRSV